MNKDLISALTALVLYQASLEEEVEINNISMRRLSKQIEGQLDLFDKMDNLTDQMW